MNPTKRAKLKELLRDFRTPMKIKFRSTETQIDMIDSEGVSLWSHPMVTPKNKADAFYSFLLYLNIDKKDFKKLPILKKTDDSRYDNVYYEGIKELFNE